MLADAADDLAVHKGAFRGIGQFELNAAVFPTDPDIEIVETFKKFLGVIQTLAAIEYGKGAAAKE